MSVRLLRVLGVCKTCKKTRGGPKQHNTATPADTQTLRSYGERSSSFSAVVWVVSHTLPGLCYHGEPPKKHYHTQTRRIRKMPIEAVVTSLRLKVCNRARYYKLPLPSRKAPQFANFSPFLSHRLSSPFEPSRGKFPISGKSSSPSRTQLPVQDIQTLHGNSIITSFTTTARQLHFPPPPSPLNSLPGSWLSTPTHQKNPPNSNSPQLDHGAKS